MSKYDAIIIGGGHNGLVCASYLSKKGYKILIIEKNEKLGGLVNCASSLNGFSSKILDDLKINLPKLNYNSYVVALNADQQHTILQENNNILAHADKQKNIINIEHDTVDAIIQSDQLVEKDRAYHDARQCRARY